MNIAAAHVEARVVASERLHTGERSKDVAIVEWQIDGSTTKSRINAPRETLPRLDNISFDKELLAIGAVVVDVDRTDHCVAVGSDPQPPLPSVSQIGGPQIDPFSRSPAAAARIEPRLFQTQANILVLP